MPFYRCLNPSSSSGGGSHCEHITLNYNGTEYPYPLELNNSNIAALCDNAFGDSNTFNSSVIIGSGVVRPDGLLQYLYNFNSPVDMKNASTMVSANFLFYYCRNYNLPVTFPKNICYYNQTFRACLNYNQPTEFFLSGNSFQNPIMYGVLMQCYNFNSRVDITTLSNNLTCGYDQFFYEANSFNQPMIFKQASTINRLFEKARSMRCPIVIDFAKNANNITTGNNCAWDGCRINNIIFLNYVNQKICWQGSETNVTFYVNDPYTFVNQCTSLYRQGANKYNYIPIENGLQADVSWYNIRVLSNVSDGLNYFNNFYYNCYGEYPNYN